MAQVSPHVKQFKDIYDAQESREGGKLTQQALEKIAAIDYTKFDIQEIQVVQNASDLPDELAVKIIKGWMRRQDELLLNLRGSLIYSPEIPRERLDQFIDMMQRPNEECKQNLIVENILHKIATGGGLRSENKIPLIDPSKFDNGIIRFDQSLPGNDARTGVQNLLDFNPNTYYYNKTTQDPFFIIGLPPFMRVRLVSYKLVAPPKLDRTLQGGPKSWDLFASNSWEDIHSGNPTKLHSVSSDMNLRNPGAEHVYAIEPKDEYFQFFKFTSTGLNHQNTNEIFLSGIDFSGNIITFNE